MRVSVEKVGELWERRMELANPRKRRRLERFYGVFEEVVRGWGEGREWSDEEVVGSEYFEYLRGYHSWWKEDPIGERAKREVVERWRDGEELFWDIKRRGMLNPIEVLVEEGREFIRRGNRRLVVLWVLGVEECEVVRGREEEWREWKDGRVVREVEMIRLHGGVC